MIERLEPHPSACASEPFAGPDHPMRQLTRAVAFGGAWSAEDAARVGGFFDSVASQWSADHVDPTKAAPVLDALERGDFSGLERRAAGDAVWIELGAGTGAGTFALAGRVRHHVAVDLAFEMLAHAPDTVPRVQADASRLPIRNDAADVVLLINMVLFPDEVDRILQPGGTVVWVNTLGDQTPIHLPPADVAAALPGEWRGRTADAGTGFWATLRRT